MKIFKWLFGDDSEEYSVLVKRGKRGKWRWSIGKKDSDGKKTTVCLSPVSGHTTFEKAAADARTFLDGVGADYLDLAKDENEEE